MSLIQSLKRDFGGVALAVVISVAAVAAYAYVRQVDLPNYEQRLELHKQMVAGTAEAPYRYRILVPFVCEAVTRLFSVALPVKYAFILSYAIFDAAAILFLLMILFAWFRIWFSRDHSLIGLLFIAAVMPMAFRDHYYQPWSLLEPGFFAAGLLAIYRRRYWLVALLTALATLNRETAVFIPLAFLFSNVDLGGSPGVRLAGDKKWLRLCAAYILIWAVVYGALRLSLGGTPHMYTLGGIWAYNTAKHNILYTPENVILFLGAFWAFAAMGYRYAPVFLKRVAPVIPLYLLTILVLGAWKEVRLLMPLYPLLVALGLCYVYRGDMNVNAP